jgi:hypothetical protein
MDAGDAGPLSEVEDGRHVRKGYTPERLTYLAEQTGFKVNADPISSSMNDLDQIQVVATSPN